MAGNGWSETIDVEIDRIDDEPARSMRAEKLADLAAEYAECLNDLPPIRVIAGPDDQHWCCDGCTRLAAYRLKGRKVVPCQIKRGTFEDAWREAARANTAHGARVTNADKRTMVERALKRFPKMTDRAIAELCSVSQPFVSGLKKDGRLITVINHPKADADLTPSHEDDIEDDDYAIGRDGKRYPRKRPRTEASKLEASPPASEPVVEDADEGPQSDELAAPIVDPHGSRLDIRERMGVVGSDHESSAIAESDETEADRFVVGRHAAVRDAAVAKAMVDGLRSRGAGARSQGSRALTGQSLLDFFNEHTDAIRFACQGGTAKGLTAACRAVVAKAFYREDHDRLREFLEILAGLKTPNGPEDSAADRLRTILLRSSRGQNIKGSQELAAQTTYALERFLRRLPTRAIIAATKDPWPLEEIG